MGELRLVFVLCHRAVVAVAEGFIYVTNNWKVITSIRRHATVTGAFIQLETTLESTIICTGNRNPLHMHFASDNLHFFSFFFS